MTNPIPTADGKTLPALINDAWQIVHDMADAVKTAIQCVEASTEYKIGNPYYEQCAGTLRNLLSKVEPNE